MKWDGTEYHITFNSDSSNFGAWIPIYFSSSFPLGTEESWAILEKLKECEVWHDKQGRPTTNKKLRKTCPLFRNGDCLLKEPMKDCIHKLKNRYIFLK